MSIWAIADLHLSQTNPATQRPSKTMDIFGENWIDHADRLESAWNDLVQPNDTVIVAGDIEWALRPDEALESLCRIDTWKGSKLLVRGNHDFWWSSKTTSKVRALLPPSIHLIHNDSVQVEGFNVCGSKGSPVPGAIEWTEQNGKLLNREVQRLKLSLGTRDVALPTIVALHYPPFFVSHEGSPYRELIDETGTVACVYGHLHGGNASGAPEGVFGRCSYFHVACDALGFRPALIAAGGEVAAPQRARPPLDGIESRR